MCFGFDELLDNNLSALPSGKMQRRVSIVVALIDIRLSVQKLRNNR